MDKILQLQEKADEAFDYFIRTGRGWSRYMAIEYAIIRELSKQQGNSPLITSF